MLSNLNVKLNVHTQRMEVQVCAGKAMLARPMDMREVILLSSSRIAASSKAVPK